MTSDISVLFSGGPDSTLAALYALDRAPRVHLLTFHNRLMGKIGKHRKVVAELQRLFGHERVVSHEDQTNDLLKVFYFGNIIHHLPTYRTFYIPWICGACKMAMHAKAIAYNRDHNIATTWDGANSESVPTFPDQAEPYIKAMKELYHSYNMVYDTPVHGIRETDRLTQEYGLSMTAETKQEHVIFSTQHTCLIGLLVHAHSKLYYVPFRGKNRSVLLAGQLLKRRIEECREFLPPRIL